MRYYYQHSNPIALDLWEENYLSLILFIIVVTSREYHVHKITLWDGDQIIKMFQQEN